MTVQQEIVRPTEAEDTTAGDMEEFESELFASVREAGVTCFPMVDLDD